MSDEPATPDTGDDPVESRFRPAAEVVRIAGESPPATVRFDREVEANDAASVESDIVEQGTDDAAVSVAPKRSPAEAFAALGDAVDGMRLDLNDVSAFVRICRERLLRQADEYRVEGLRDALCSLMRIHDLVWRQITSMEAGNVRPDGFILTLFETIESELKTHGVEVIRPQPGDDIDLEIMTTIGAAKCPFWRKPDRVAQVHRCGFVRKSEAGRQILQRAEITVSRR